MTWTCDQIEARLSDYLDGLLQPDDIPCMTAAEQIAQKLHAV